MYRYLSLLDHFSVLCRITGTCFVFFPALLRSKANTISGFRSKNPILSRTCSAVTHETGLPFSFHSSGRFYLTCPFITFPLLIFFSIVFNSALLHHNITFGICCDESKKICMGSDSAAHTDHFSRPAALVLSRSEGGESFSATCAVSCSSFPLADSRPLSL